MAHSWNPPSRMSKIHSSYTVNIIILKIPSSVFVCSHFLWKFNLHFSKGKRLTYIRCSAYCTMDIIVIYTNQGAITWCMTNIYYFHMKLWAQGVYIYIYPIYIYIYLYNCLPLSPRIYLPVASFCLMTKLFGGTRFHGAARGEIIWNISPTTLRCDVTYIHRYVKVLY